MADALTVNVPATTTGPVAPNTPPPAPAGQPAPATRPTGLPEKFKSVEDMIAAYGELEKKLGAGTTPPPPATTTPPPAPEQKPAAARGAEDFTKYESEFAEKGTLSDESYAALEAKGYNRVLVDGYIAGQVARANALTTEVHTAVGGQEKYAAMTQWAAGKLTAAEVTAYNEAVNSGDAAKVKMAVAGLNARFVADSGVSPNLIGGERTASGAAPFESMAQVRAAMSDRRYSADPSYRKEVEQRLANSSIF